MSVRDTVKGIGIRAAVLGVGGLVVGGLFTAAMLKAASTVIKILLGVMLLLIGGSVATWELKKVQKSLDRGHTGI